MKAESLFLDERRFLLGPWQAFERDVARLLLFHGFDDVRLVGGTGDRGGDVLGSKRGELWVFQCKHTTSSPPPRSAIREIVEAGKYYGAQRLAVAMSRPPNDAFLEERSHYSRMGLTIGVADPAYLYREVREAPEYPPSRRKLRDYQEDAFVRLRDAFVDAGKGQLVMATGLGKTIVMAETVADLLRDDLVENGAALVLAHTREIVGQLHRQFWYQLPKWVPTHQMTEGEIPAYWEGITFATIQSASSRVDDLPRFGLVLVDEAHHVGAQIFQETLDRLDPPMLGGVTATPWRGDEFDIDQILGAPLLRIGIAEGLQRGFLTEADYRLLADNLDWKFVQEASRHKYSLRQLNRKLLIPTRDDEAAKIVSEVFHVEGRRGGIAFSPTILHAQQFAGTLRAHALRAEAVTSDMLPRERDLMMSRFRAGRMDIVVTVDLFNEGVDVPDVDIVVFMRATHSRRIFVQQLGRGLRISPGKDKVVVLDFVSDLRRVAEVIELDRAVRGRAVEHLGLGPRLVEFRDASAGGFLREWMLDQASLILREGDPDLDVPRFEFPEPPQPGDVE
ncbi:MAG TPA: DEAD/DEAH box helicase family protein [Thermoplasmata archaeon]|nr:DEAD/DEAH box helicase family protein [Thermoplasmata archaeon]